MALISPLELFQNDHSSSDAAGVEKSDVKNKRDDSDVSLSKDKSKESGGRTSAACDRNTPNSAHTADSNGSNLNGASADDTDTQVRRRAWFPRFHAFSPQPRTESFLSCVVVVTNTKY